jgi:hypothetical protein
MFLAPLILQLVGEHIRGEDFEAPTLSDLLRELRRVEPGYDGWLLARLATGKVQPGEAGLTSLTGTALVRRDVHYMSVAEGTDEDIEATRLIWPQLTAKAIRVAKKAQYGEAEDKAGRRLGVAAGDIALTAQHLWGCSLTDERDARVAEQLRERGLGPKASQPLRGHVTRRLLADIAAELERRFSKPARARKQRAPARQPRTTKKTARRLSAG